MRNKLVLGLQLRMLRLKFCAMTSKQIKDLMTRLGVKRQGLAELTGANIRTVDGWLSDHPKRRPSPIAKKILEMLSKP